MDDNKNENDIGLDTYLESTVDKKKRDINDSRQYIFCVQDKDKVISSEMMVS